MKNNFNTNLITENRSEAMQIAKVIFGNKNVNLYTAGELIHISIDGDQIASIDTASGKLIVNQYDLFSGKINASEYLSELEKLRLALSRKNIVRYKQVSTAQVGLFGLSDNVLTQASLINDFQAILKKLDLGNLTAYQKEEIVQIGYLLEIEIDFDVIDKLLTNDESVIDINPSNLYRFKKDIMNNNLHSGTTKFPFKYNNGLQFTGKYANDMPTVITSLTKAYNLPVSLVIDVLQSNSPINKIVSIVNYDAITEKSEPEEYIFDEKVNSNSSKKDLTTYNILQKYKHDLNPKWEIEKFQTGGRQFLSYKDAQDFKKKLQSMSSSMEYKVVPNIYTMPKEAKDLIVSLDKIKDIQDDVVDLFRYQQLKNSWVEGVNLLKNNTDVLGKKLTPEKREGIFNSVISAQNKIFALERRDKTNKSENVPNIYTMPKEGALLLLDKTVVDTVDKTIPALFAIIELEKLIPSNDGITFNKNRNYPQECQSRDYSTTTEQSKVMNNAKNFDATFLISNIKTPADGAPIIDKNGIVYGGNSRTMVLQRVARFGNFNEMYVNELIKSANLFGLNPNDLKRFKYPVLVKVIDKPNNCGALSQELQRNRTADQDEITLAIAMSKQLPERTIEKIATLLDNYDLDNFSDLLNNSTTKDSLINELRRVGIINATNQAKWLNVTVTKDNRTLITFSDIGKKLFEFMLLAKLFPNKHLLESSGTFSNVISPNIEILTRINTLPKDWNIVENIKDAIEKNLQAKASGMNFKEFVSQSSAFDNANDVSENTKIIWKAMLHSKPRVFGNALKSYYNSAKNAINGDAMFNTDATSTEVLRTIFGNAGLNDSADYSNLMDEVIPTRWDMQFNDNDYSEDDFQQSLQLPKLPTLEDAKRKNWTQKQVPLRRTAELLPGLLDNAKILVFGRQGSGKSTFVLQLMDDLGKSGKVLFVSAEEKASARLQERLIRNRIAGRNIEILNTNDWAVIKDFADRGDYKYIVVDSHNSVIGTTQKGILNFVATHPDTFMVFISRMSKNGKDVLGSSDWGYDVDTEIYLNDGVAKTLKHRDGISGREMRVMSKDYSTLTSL